MSKKYQSQNKLKRKAQKLARKRAQQAQYQAWAAEGITKGSRRKLIKKRKGARLAKDHKVINAKAVLARPNFRAVPGWVNRKAERLGLN